MVFEDGTFGKELDSDDVMRAGIFVMGFVPLGQERAVALSLSRSLSFPLYLPPSPNPSTPPSLSTM